MGYRIRVWACLLLSTAAMSAPAQAPVQIKAGWVRWLPGELPAGGYLTLVNTSSVPVVLTGAASADYGSVSLHQSRLQDGNTQMVPVGSIAIAPHSTLDFQAVGYHLMLLQPKRTLHAGEHVDVTLTFASGATLTGQLELRGPDALSPQP
jgi:copper(I)-binding protein